MGRVWYNVFILASTNCVEMYYGHQTLARLQEAPMRQGTPPHISFGVHALALEAFL